MSDNGSASKREARRQKILEQGQRRLNHITFGNGGSNVSRALDFDASSLGGSLTPAATGLDPSDWQREGAALTAKSWLALQDSPSKSPSKSSTGRPSPSKSPQQTPLAPAHSAAQLPVSSPATMYASDDESPGIGSPIVSGVAGNPSAASNDTAIDATAPPPPSPQPQPPQQPSARSQLAAASADGESAPAAASRSDDGSSFVCHSPAKAETQLAASPAAAGTAKSKQAPDSSGVALMNALQQTAALRSLLAISVAAVAVFDLHRLALDSLAQHALPQPVTVPQWAPLVILLVLQLAVIGAQHFLGGAASGVATYPQSQPYSGMRAIVTSMLSAAAPRSYSAVTIVSQLCSSLWQDVALYLLLVHLCATLAVADFQLQPQWLEMLNNLEVWRVAASRWTL